MSEQAFWEDLWSRDGGLKPGTSFDILTPSPALVELVKSNQLPKGDAALVPRCGRGYDVTFLASSGHYKKVIGIDLAKTGVQAANERLKSLEGKERPPQGSVEFICGDFFEYQFGEQKFDMIYDYTFLCGMS